MNPIIILPGIGQSKVNIADANGNKVQSAFPPSIDAKAIISDLKGDLLKMMLFRKDKGFSDKIAKIAREAVAPLSTGPDGKPAMNARAVTYNKPVSECAPDEKRHIYRMIPMEELGEEAGEDNLFFFAYNPFGNLFDTVEELHAYIAMVRERTGAEKVNLIVVSLSGVLLRGYMLKYGASELDKVVNVVSALDGTAVVADAYEKKLKTDDPVGMLKSMGGKFAKVAELANMVPAEVMRNCIDKSYAVGAESLLHNCTIMWGAIPRDRFEPIYNAYLRGKGKPELEAEVSEFNEYNQDFAAHAKETEEQYGVKFYQLCGFDRELVPVVDSVKLSSDGMINLGSASFGTTEPEAGSGSCESGCVFPDRTWFFKNQQHDDIAWNDAALSLVKSILTGEVENVDSSEKFPRINGVRNTRKLKYTLVPQAKTFLAKTDLPEDIRSELSACVGSYEELLKATEAVSQEPVRTLEARFNAAFEKMKSEE